MAKGDAKRERKRREEEFQTMLAELCGLDAEDAQRASQRLTMLFNNVQSTMRAVVGELYYYKYNGIPTPEDDARALAEWNAEWNARKESR